jgi:hypothetical protein
MTLCTYRRYAYSMWKYVEISENISLVYISRDMSSALMATCFQNMYYISENMDIICKNHKSPNLSHIFSCFFLYFAIMQGLQHVRYVHTLYIPHKTYMYIQTFGYVLYTICTHSMYVFHFLLIETMKNIYCIFRKNPF